jgi:hypothetical protein
MRSIYVRDLKVGTVVIVPPRAFQHVSHEGTVAEVARYADLIEPAQHAVARAKSRKALRAAAEDLLAALDAVVDYGREAHRVRFEGEKTPLSYESSATFEWCGERSRR